MSDEIPLDWRAWVGYHGEREGGRVLYLWHPSDTCILWIGRAYVHTHRMAPLKQENRKVHISETKYVLFTVLHA